MKHTRSSRDLFYLSMRMSDLVAKSSGHPIAVEQYRKIGYTPKGFKSSRPKAER